MKLVFGLVAIGLGEKHVLAWRWTDYFSYLTKKEPNEPSFRSVDYVPRASPLPVAIISARGDEYIPFNINQQLIASAKEPKKLSVIEANNHRFDDKQPEFFQALREALDWIRQVRP